MSSTLHLLKDKDLAAVVFIRDYMQLLFDGPYLNVYVWPIVVTEDNYILDHTSPGYRDALCAQIGKQVATVKEHPDIKLHIGFIDGVRIEIPLEQRYRRGVEAAMLQADGGKEWQVW